METLVLRLPGCLVETFLEQMELETPPSSSPFTGVTPASQPAGARPPAAPSSTVPSSDSYTFNLFLASAS